MREEGGGGRLGSERRRWKRSLRTRKTRWRRGKMREEGGGGKLGRKGRGIEGGEGGDGR